MTAAGLAVFALLAVPAAPPPLEPDLGPPPVAAAAWCAVYTDGDEPNLAPEPGPDPEQPAAAANDDRLGCDVGVGAALYRWRRAAFVGLFGTQSLGPGLSWAFHRPAEGPVWAVGFGVTVPWSLEDGINLDRRSLVVGGTLSFVQAKP